MFNKRKEAYERLENERQSKVLTYVTGDRPNLEAQIHPEVFDFFVNHLDQIGVVKKISLILYTRGGNTLAAWSLVNLIKQFCDELEIIIPSKCHSAGTLMALGANKLVMTKQATLGPIDPSLTTPLNPQIEGAPLDAKAPVSVEAIKGFIQLAKDELGIRDDKNITDILLRLSEKVHPLVLGQVYRCRSQIQMLARRLLKDQMKESDKIDKVVSFLCSDSGSHDYTINRREAKNELGLIVETPSPDFYSLIKLIYDNIRDDLKLSESFDPNAIASCAGGRYVFKRALIESLSGGSNFFSSEGQIVRIAPPLPSGMPIPGMPPGATQLQDTRLFEGWRHEK